MRKLILTIMPYLLICSIFIYDHMFPYKDLIIIGVVILFPIIFIFQGIIHSNSIKNMLINSLLSSIIMWSFFNNWYSSSGTSQLVLTYIAIGFVTVIIKRFIYYVIKNRVNS